MHYVSWDRTQRDAPKLLAEAGPEVLGEFTHESATVGGQQWDLLVAPESGAVAKCNGEKVVEATASLARAKEIPVHIGERSYVLVNEWGKNWVVNDAAGEKVAQFTQDHNGVRKAILEFEGETTLPATDVAGLAWVSREVLEAKKLGISNALIGTLLLFSGIIVLVMFL